MIPDVDMNKLAKRYKQLRKSGEYIGGLSTDNQPRLTQKMGPGEKVRQDGRLKVQAAHRRVKSGISDGRGSLLNPMLVKEHPPSSGQRSKKSI